MATRASEVSMKQRKECYDRISFTMPKGTRYIIHAQAMREGCSSAEVIRRSILARCGLEEMPDIDTPQYQKIKDAKGQMDADKAFTFLQQHERETEKSQGTAYMVTLAGRAVKDSYIVSMLALLDTIEDTFPPTPDVGWQPPDKIFIDKRNISEIRRLLSNMIEVEPDEDEANDL